MLRSLGKVTVAPAGTPVKITGNLTYDPTGRYAVHGVLIQALSGNTGKVYIGEAGMNKTTGVGVHAVLPIPTTNFIPSFAAALTLSPAAVIASDIYIDVDVAGEGVTGSILIT